MKIFKKGKLSDGDIHKWLVELRPHAYIPESGFAVSVVLRASLAGEDDYYFAGVNVENTDHRLSTHGEEGAIAAMIAALGNQAKIVELWAMGAPRDLNPGDKSPYADACATCCGKCRQQIAELATPDARIHYVSLNGKLDTTTVGDFLPKAFTLPVAVTPSKPVVVSAAEAASKILRKGPLSQADIESWLKSLEPVDLISKVSQSIVVELDTGFFAAGTRVEGAAFIDISASQAAMAIAAGAFGLFKVKAAWVDTRGDVSGKGTILPLSLLQVLLAFAKDKAVPLRYNGKVTTLGEAISFPL